MHVRATSRVYVIAARVAGSGRVTFSSHKSFMKAVNAACVEIKTPKFTKKVRKPLYMRGVKQVHV